MSNASAAMPRLAATVVLFREAEAALEVLLVRRHSGMAFMGGVWVFPGGGQDPADLSHPATAAVPEDIRSSCAARWTSPPSSITSAESLAMWFTAVRETFEESGILLCRSGGDPIPPDRAKRLAERRPIAGDPPMTFAGLLARDGLSIDVPSLVPWLRWITPSVFPTRFDTCFFVAPLPDGQDCALNGEATEYRWIAPLAAVKAWERGELALVTPTVLTLCDLAYSLERHATIRRMLQHEADRPLPPITPKILVEETSSLVLLPWDREYPWASGEGEALPDAPGALARAPSRMRIPRSDRAK